MTHPTDLRLQLCFAAIGLAVWAYVVQSRVNQERGQYGRG
jgi:hypothetical protein